MIRCPEGYCCQDDRTCAGIDSCNVNRLGIMCGNCVANWTESLYSATCVPVHNCENGLVLGLFFLGVMVYSVGLLTFKFFKEKIVSGISSVYHVAKRCLCIETKTITGSNGEHVAERNGGNTTMQDASKDVKYLQDDSTKYLQILFHSIQDASLFKVFLPGENVGEKGLVETFLQFSPELLVTLHTRVTILCFSPVTNAVVKIMFKTLFGPCVLLLLLVLFTLESGFPVSRRKQLLFSKSVRACLIRAFLLAISFSYQQIVKGLFTLVQCVEAVNKLVMYVQGEIECYTWWQTTIETWICLSLIPLFPVLSHAAYFVKERRMSVCVFVLACLFPLPVIMIYSLMNYCEHRSGNKQQSENSCEIRSKQTEDNMERRADLLHFDESGEISVVIKSNADAPVEVSTINDSDTDIAGEYSSDLNRVEPKNGFADEKEDSDTDTLKTSCYIYLP